MLANKNKSIGQITVIFFIQATSTIAYAVFYSGLSLFLTQKMHYSRESSATITGLFLSLNYLLPLIGGLLANKTITYKNLYFLVNIASLLGCLLLIHGNHLHLSLAFFLMQSMSNVCLNMFITQLFTRNQIRQRRTAFTWNYIGMNLGFMIGYFFTGLSTLSNSYNYLFILMCCMILLSIGLVLCFINGPAINTINSKKFSLKHIATNTSVILILVSSIKLLFDYAEFIHTALILISIASMTSLLLFAYIKSERNDKSKIKEFIYFSFFSIAFWSAYLLTPIAIMQLINNNAQRYLFGLSIAPQWFTNLNSIVIMIIAPIMAVAIKHNRAPRLLDNTSHFFSIGFAFASLAFAILFTGLGYLTMDGKLLAPVIVGYLTSLTIGEILINPTSNALVGELVSESLKEIMTGVGYMNIALGGLISSIIANRLIFPYINMNGLSANNCIQLRYSILLLEAVLLFFAIIIPFTISRQTTFNNALTHEA